MKTLEQLILIHLHPLMGPFMGLLQFAYQPGIVVEDAIIFLLESSLSHLEKSEGPVKIMSFDFASVFNTRQPALLGDKLELMGADQLLTSWILHYLSMTLWWHQPFSME